MNLDTAKLKPDCQQIGQFVETVFKNATSGFVSLRAFTHGKNSEPWGRQFAIGDDGRNHLVWPAVPITETDKLIEAATVMAGMCANADQRVVFAPPTTTLSVAWGARTEHVAEGVALSLESDGPDTEHQNAKPPYEALEILLDIMGPPTLAMTSGSVWTDPDTGEQQWKWHAHYRLRSPTRDPEAHEKLREARRLLAQIVGADGTASSLVHPLRWAGSWNRKSEPVLAEIIEINDEIEIDLDETLTRLRQKLIELGLTTRIERPQAEHTYDSEGDDDIEAKALAALAAIPNDLHYWDWVNIGFEIWDALWIEPWC